MKCEDIQRRVDEYVDDTLTPGEIDLVDAHLGVCAECRSEVAAEKELRLRTAKLQTSIDPPEVVWRGIAESIAEQKVLRPRFGRGLVAVAAAAALVFAAVLAGYSVGRQHGRVEAALDRSALESAGSQLSLAALDVGTYQVARDQLLSALEDRRASISTDTLRVVEENLGVIDQAIVRITAALSKNPNNPQLTHRLASVYRQQIELLQRATRLPDET
jgi:hypothetical protein